MYLFIAALAVDASCNKTYNVDSKTINSPNYPRSYPESKHCTWHVGAPTGLKIRVETFPYSMDHDIRSTDCNWDSLKIYDGSSNCSRRVANLCGRNAFSGMNSSTNNIFFEFNSDDAVVYEGFHIILALIGIKMDFIIN